MGWVLFRDFLVNLAAGMVGDITSPTGMIGFILTLGCIAYAVRAWHRKRREAGKRGMDSWYFISLAFVIAIAAVGAAAYGIGTRSNASQGVPSQGSDTHLGLKFGPSGTTPVATDLANIWRWYALKSVAVVILPDGQRKELPSWNLFITLDKPVDAKQVLIEGDALPQYEVKDRDSRSVVVAFMGDILNSALKVTVESSVGIKPQPATIAAPTQIQAPPITNPSPVKSKFYFPDEKTKLGNLLSAISDELNSDGLEIVKSSQRFSVPETKESLLELRGRIEATRILVNTLNQKIWTGLIQKNQKFVTELDQIVSPLSVGGNPIAEMSGVLQDLATQVDIFNDRYDKLDNESRRWVGSTLLSRFTEASYRKADSFNAWIQTCNSRIDDMREALR
jgi:hypothetical protein